MQTNVQHFTLLYRNRMIDRRIDEAILTCCIYYYNSSIYNTYVQHVRIRFLYRQMSKVQINVQHINIYEDKCQIKVQINVQQGAVT